MSVVTLFLVAYAATGPHAAERVFRAGEMRVERPWVRASVGTSRPTVGYLALVNEGSKPDRLVGVKTPVADRAEIHRTTVENDTMQMRPAEPLEIPAGATVTLMPGGLHIMIIGLKEPLKKGATMPLMLQFETAGEMQIEATVSSIGAKRAPE